MLLAPQPDALRHIRSLAALAVFALLSACSPYGDFGELRPTLVRDDIHAFVGRDATVGAPHKMSAFELTDDERLLRDLGYPLLEQPYNRQPPFGVFHETGVWGGDRRAIFDPTRYTDHLLGDSYRSPSARYARLIDDIRNDIVRIGPFFEVASRVLYVDGKREKAIVLANSGEWEAKNARRRIHENAAIVASVRGSLDRRVASYQFALERLVVMTPSPPHAVEAERALKQLKWRIGGRGPIPPPVRVESGSLGRPL